MLKEGLFTSLKWPTNKTMTCEKNSTQLWSIYKRLYGMASRVVYLSIYSVTTGEITNFDFVAKSYDYLGDDYVSDISLNRIYFAVKLKQ